MSSTENFFRRYIDMVDEVSAGMTPAMADPKVAAGVKQLGTALGSDQNSTIVAKGLDTISKGKVTSGQVSQAIAPFIEPLEKILADPAMKNKFIALVKQIQPDISEQDLSVVKDDDTETVLVDKTKGTKTVIDKKNPNSPKLAPDAAGKMVMQAPQPGSPPKPAAIKPGTPVKVI